jgi:UDP-N-acetylglucosamine:LPS N-acetylglucosamine transferase
VSAHASSGRRVLLLSAPVGEGHDAAARAVASQLRECGATTETLDGLAILGPLLARTVLRGYRLQVRRALWTWAILYAVTRSNRVLRLAGWLIAVYGGRRLLRAIEMRGVDCIVSTYPLISAALASLRRRGKLPVTCVAVITDFDPHPGWCHPDLDANLSVASGAGVVSIAPPVRLQETGATSSADLRRTLGIPPGERVAIIAGGAWGVGNLRGAALAVSSLPGVHPVVVTGRNEHLRARLSRELADDEAKVLGYVDELGSLLHAADVVVQHAGGVTCLEAFAAGRPVVMYDPVPGHGKRNARLMEAAGLVATAATGVALCGLLSSDRYWSSTAPACVSAGLELFRRPDAAAALEALGRRAVSAPVRRRSWVMPVIGVGLAALLAVAFVFMHSADPDLPRWAFTHGRV